jgi:hypothetical protein
MDDGEIGTDLWWCRSTLCSKSQLVNFSIIVIVEIPR